jgi:phage tail tape-measure protein
MDATAKAGTIAAAKSGMATGAALGSIIPGLGTAVGGVIGGALGSVAGLFGSRKAKEEAERQLRIARNRTQDANSQRRNVAYTIGLRNQFNRENETDTSQSLFHAEKGKEGAVNPMTMETYKKHIVNTAYGKMFAP